MAFSGGMGTLSDPYLISTVEQLASIVPQTEPQPGVHEIRYSNVINSAYLCHYEVGYVKDAVGYEIYFGIVEYDAEYNETYSIKKLMMHTDLVSNICTFGSEVENIIFITYFNNNLYAYVSLGSRYTFYLIDMVNGTYTDATPENTSSYSCPVFVKSSYYSTTGHLYLVKTNAPLGDSIEKWDGVTWTNVLPAMADLDHRIGGMVWDGSAIYIAGGATTANTDTFKGSFQKVVNGALQLVKAPATGYNRNVQEMFYFNGAMYFLYANEVDAGVNIGGTMQKISPYVPTWKLVVADIAENRDIRHISALNGVHAISRANNTETPYDLCVVKADETNQKWVPVMYEETNATGGNGVSAWIGKIYSFTVPGIIRKYTDLLGSCYKQTCDLDFTGVDWVPLGSRAASGNAIDAYTPSEYFTGSYDGGGYNISNLTFNLSPTSPYSMLYRGCGLFGCVKQSTPANAIQNINMKNVVINMDGVSPSCVGGLVGLGEDIRLLNCNIDATFNLINGVESSYCAGLIGDCEPDNSWSEIIRCSANTEWNDLGNGPLDAGICECACLIGSAWMSPGKIEDCHASGNVFGEFYVGIFIGNGGGFTINNCSAVGDVVCSDGWSSVFGGGEIDDATITNCYSMGNVTVTMKPNSIGLFLSDAYTVDMVNCYAAGSLINTSGLPDGCGWYRNGSWSMDCQWGIFADVGGSDGATTTNCYYDATLEPTTTDNTTAVGLTTEQMKAKLSYDNWDFENIWGTSPAVNNGYPTFKWLIPYIKPRYAALSVGGTEVEIIIPPNKSTQNAIVRWSDVEGRVVDNSEVTVSNAGDVSIPISQHYMIGDRNLLYSDVGAAPLVHVHNAGEVTTGVLSTARLGIGVAEGVSYLSGDSTWKTIPIIGLEVTSLIEGSTVVDTLDATNSIACHWQFVAYNTTTNASITGMIMSTWSTVLQLINYSNVTSTMVGAGETIALHTELSSNTVTLVVSSSELGWNIKLKRIVL